MQQPGKVEKVVRSGLRAAALTCKGYLPRPVGHAQAAVSDSEEDSEPAEPKQELKKVLI